VNLPCESAAIAPEETMNERLMEYFGVPGLSLPPEDYWLVYRQEGGGWAVTPETAEYVARMLDRRVPPKWVTFKDVTGAVVRVRIRTITALEEFSSDQRVRAQAFWQRVQGEGEDTTSWQ
jgi:hypothetical protein